MTRETTGERTVRRYLVSVNGLPVDVRYGPQHGAHAVELTRHLGARAQLYVCWSDGSWEEIEVVKEPAGEKEREQH